MCVCACDEGEGVRVRVRVCVCDRDVKCYVISELYILMLYVITTKYNTFLSLSL